MLTVRLVISTHNTDAGRKLPAAVDMMSILSIICIVSISSASAFRLPLYRTGGSKFNANLLREKRSISTTTTRPTEVRSSKDDDGVKDRPFTLPAGQFKPKQSLGQNFLSDQNYVLKICDAFTDTSSEGHRVVEIGPGPGALTRVLYQRYPSMTAIEIDQRAVAFLGEKLPGLPSVCYHRLRFSSSVCFLT